METSIHGYLHSTVVMSLHRDAKQFFIHRQSIQLTNCTIKNAFLGKDKLELIVNDSTTITKLNKIFSVEFPDPQTGTNRMNEISPDMLNEQPEFQIVSVKVQVLEVGDTISLNDSCQLQNVLAADHSATAKIALGKTMLTHY